MQRLVFYLSFFVFILFISGCNRDDEPNPDHNSSSQGENVYDDFNRWTYYVMNEQYLWRKDLPDSLDCNYNLPPADFFKSLLSDKDRFSYFTNNPYYSRSVSDDCQISYGYEYQEVLDQDGVTWQYVLYVYGDIARKQGIKRGDLLFSEGGNTVRKAIVKDGKVAGVRADRITLAADFPGNERSTVLVDKILNIDNKKIGYLCYLEFDSEEDLYPVLKRFYEADIDELVLDLRYNPGGYVSTCRYLCNCIVDEKGYGNVFQYCSYNDRLSNKYEKETGSPITKNNYDKPADSYEGTLGVTPVLPLDMKKIYVLITGSTASASEATMVCLNPYTEVVTIGETSVGKGVGSWTFYDPEYVYALQPITMRYYNANMQTTPDTGIEPDYPVEDGLSIPTQQLGDIDEPLLNMALSLIFSSDKFKRKNSVENSIVLTPVGEPSYLKKFKNKYHENV